MDLTDLIPYVTDGGVAFIVLVLVMTGFLVPGWSYKEKKEEIRELQIALDHERERSDAANAAAAATRDILLSLHGRMDPREVDRALSQKR